MRILEQKGYVSHESFGKSHRYFPLVKKEQFTQSVISSLMHNYFGGSFKRLVNFISDSNDISITELDEVLTDLKKQKDGNI
jgi:predicted transcriptional regulator